MFEIFYLDGFDWTDLLDFLSVPHYSNDHDLGNGTTKHYRQRTIAGPDSVDYDILVLWEGQEEPTDDQITAMLKEDSEDDE